MELTDEHFFRSIANEGDPKRLLDFVKRAKNGEELTIGAIGGSITAGAGATCEDTRYANRLLAAFMERFPKSKFNLVNAGIGASNSLFGTFRVEKDLLSRKPDIIFIDFSVNDKTNPLIQISYEALLRQCLVSEPKPPVIAIAMVNHLGENTQQDHLPVARHYAIPFISYADGIYPDVRAGKIVWQDISPDFVHPNDKGHGIVADLVMHYVDTIMNGNFEPTTEHAIPAYLNPAAESYENGSICDAKALKIVENNGWTTGPHKAGYTGWQSDTPGAILKIRTTASTIVIGYKQFCGDFGRVAATLEGHETVILEGHYTKMAKNPWAGGHTVLSVLCSAEEKKERTLTLKLLEDKHTESTGHKFDFGYLLQS